MAHEIEIKNGVASFAENGRRERAWHGLGQVFDRPMTVTEALQASHADYEVTLQPIAVLTPTISEHLADDEYALTCLRDEVIDAVIRGKKCTMRMDDMRPLGIVSDTYGVVQNRDAFKFIDMLLTGKDGANAPIIESAGVLGHGERVFITAKFPDTIRLDNKGNDMVEMYVVFTTSHDGTGSVTCLVTPVRVVCNNTLNYAMHKNSGRIHLRHTSGIMGRIDLTNEENASYAYKTLGMFDVYKKSLERSFQFLNQVRLSVKEAEDIVAKTFLPEETYKLYKAEGIGHPDISRRAQNRFEAVMTTLENGVGQDLLEAGTGTWLVQGISCYGQNVATYSNDEQMFDSVTTGLAAHRLQRVVDELLT